MENDSAQGQKEQGNSFFKSGHFKQAREAYTKAVEHDPKDATLLSNRAAAYLKLGEIKEALQDAEAAICLKPEWGKAHYRRGAALEQAGKLEEALHAFERGLTLSPDSKELSDKVTQVERRLRQQRQKEERPRGGGGPASGSGAFGVHKLQGLPRMPEPDSWAEGLTPAKKYEWLVDCYRMRVDDDYAWNGGYLRGLYHPEANNEKVAEDFLVFCKLAVENGVVPKRNWDWGQFLKTAVGLLPYAFEKSDAKDKWGGENIFASMLGQRSLRATAEVSYKIKQLTSAQCEPGKSILDDVGGQAEWRCFLNSLQICAPAMYA